MSLRLYQDGDSYVMLHLPGALHVNSAQSYEAAALAGLGLIQAPLLTISIPDHLLIPKQAAQQPNLRGAISDANPLA